MSAKTKTTRKATKPAKPAKKYIPITWAEVHDTEQRFESWLEAKGGKAAVKAFKNLTILRIFAEGGVTVAGQKEVAKIRRELDRFLGKP